MTACVFLKVGSDAWWEHTRQRMRRRSRPPPGRYPPVVVRCFFHCGHTTEARDPSRAHAAMEDHYQTEHRADLAAWAGQTG